jgi:hypothetical protein
MSEKVTRLALSAIFLILLFAGVPVISARQDRGPPQKMLKNLSRQMDLSEDRNTQLKPILET